MNTYWHPSLGTVTIERLLANGCAIVLTVKDESAVVALDSLTLALEAAAA